MKARAYSLAHKFAAAFFALSLFAPQAAHATGPYGTAFAVWYLFGIVAVAGMFVLIVALVLFGPVYLANPSKKHHEKMAQLSEGKRKFHSIVHRIAAVTVGVLVLVVIGMIIYAFIPDYVLRGK